MKYPDDFPLTHWYLHNIFIPAMKVLIPLIIIYLVVAAVLFVVAG